jgi:hypothetical protein
MIRLRHTLSLLLVVPILTACGGASDDAPNAAASSDSPAAIDASPAESKPKCADVWSPGKTIDDAYTGCEPADGEQDLGVKPCSTGSGTFAGYHGQGTEMFAILGQAVVDEDDADLTAYDKFYADCFGN